jgi:hypothetical protein
MRGLYPISVLMHVLAAMTWIGGMAVFVIAVMPHFRRQPEAAKVAFLEWFGPRLKPATIDFGPAFPPPFALSRLARVRQ